MTSMAGRESMSVLESVAGSGWWIEAMTSHWLVVADSVVMASAGGGAVKLIVGS